MSIKSVNPDKQNPTMHRIVGFSLIELMIIIAVIGILASVATPALHTMLINRQADHLTTELELDISFARNQAVSRTRAIIITPIDGSWSTGWEVQDNGVVLRRTRTNRNSMDAAVITSPDYTSLSPLTFDSQGRVAGTGAFNINVPNCTGDRIYTVDIRFLGQIVISGTTCP